MQNWAWASFLRRNLSQFINGIELKKKEYIDILQANILRSFQFSASDKIAGKQSTFLISISMEKVHFSEHRSSDIADLPSWRPTFLHWMEFMFICLPNMCQLLLW